MPQQSTESNRAVELLAAGDHVSDANGVHRVVHTFDFRDGDGRQAVAVTLHPLGHGQPWIARHHKGHELRLATNDEVTAYRELDQRTALANGLHSLAHLVMDQRLPIDFSYFSIVLDTPAQVEAWAKAGSAAVKEVGGRATADFEVSGLTVHAHAPLPTPAVEPSDDELADVIDRAFAPATAEQQAGE